MELKELISKAKEKEVKAMEELFIQFKPLLKSRAKRYSKLGLEYDDIFNKQLYYLLLLSMIMRKDPLLPLPVISRKESTGDYGSTIGNT